MKQKKISAILPGNSKRISQVAPWLIGAGLGIGHFAMTSNCTVSQQGRCTTCGSCVIALGTLVAWAVLNKTRDKDLYHSK